MDKLAMEEAGFQNCVSVPDGAPPKVSDKELPAQEKVSARYSYYLMSGLLIAFNLNCNFFSNTIQQHVLSLSRM